MADDEGLSSTVRHAAKAFIDAGLARLACLIAPIFVGSLGTDGVPEQGRGDTGAPPAFQTPPGEPHDPDQPHRSRRSAW
ncbi:MAG: hypothetical protein H7306_15650 [Bacteriovorax sp.]|nr:hypothetical protein [Rhizobacter sp.]